MVSSYTKDRIADFIFYSGFCLAVIAIVLGIVGLIGVGVNHSGHVDCLRLHESTGLETKYKRSGMIGECYIKIGDQWVPKANWTEDQE